jgi:aspartate racemase
VYVFPTSFAQQGPWFHAQLLPESTAYHIFYAVAIEGPLDALALEQSLNALIGRHEVLRTTFEARDGQPWQVIHPAARAALPVLDLSDLPARAREAEILRLANQQAGRPFDLARGPLLRASLLHMGAREHLLLLTIHHIIFDEWSLSVFLGELADLYRGARAAGPPPVPEPPLQYADYSVWQRERLREGVLEDDLLYWKQQLQGTPTESGLITGQPRPGVPSGRGYLHLFSFSQPLSASLKALSRREGVSLFTTLVAAFSTLLFRYGGQEDLHLGAVTAGRDRAETEDMIGIFINTLVLRTDLSGNPTFRELLGRTHSVVLQALAHQHLPFEHLLRELRPERALGRNPFFGAMLAFQPPPPVLPPGWELVPLQVQTGAALFELDLEIYDRPEGLLLHLQYDTGVFDEATITRLVGHWQKVLEGMVTDVGQRISDVPLLTDTERRQQLVEWNATGVDYPLHRCFSELFEEQVERTPQALAVSCEGEQLTYRELNEGANRLAHHLQGLGVGPETLVAILAERGPAFLISILAIFKAGGAYLPLDPAHPAGRLRQCARYSRAAAPGSSSPPNSSPRSFLRRSGRCRSRLARGSSTLRTCASPVSR